MTLMCAWQTSGMPIFNHQCPKSITLSVDQSLEWRMLARWQSSIEQSMVEKQVEEISETTLGQECLSSVTNIPEALHHLWTRVWNGKCWQGGNHA